MRKHFSYLVYDAQILQALRAETLHMQLPQRDVPQKTQKSRKLKYKVKFWKKFILASRKLLSLFKTVNKSSKIWTWNTVLLSTRWQHSLDNETILIKHYVNPGAAGALLLVTGLQGFSCCLSFLLKNKTKQSKNGKVTPTMFLSLLPFLQRALISTAGDIRKSSSISTQNHIFLYWKCKSD